MALKHRLLKPLGSQERYVAVLDILGFRQLVENNDTTGLVDVLAHVRDLTAVATGFAAEVENGKRLEVEFVQYSDSFLLYTQGTSFLELDIIIRATASTISGMMLWGVLARGAIVRGDLFVSGNRQVVAGKALVRGHDLERQLDWAGAVIDEGTINSETEQRVLAHEAKEGWLMRYDIPWKTGPAKGFALGWPHMVDASAAKHHKKQVIDLLGAPDRDAKRKQRSTWEFRRAHSKRYPTKPYPTKGTMTPEARKRYGAAMRLLERENRLQKAEAKKLGLSMGDFLALRMRQRLDSPIEEQPGPGQV